MEILRALFEHLANPPYLALSQTRHQNAYILSEMGAALAPEIRQDFIFGLWKGAPHRFLIQDQSNGLVVYLLSQPIDLTLETTLEKIREVTAQAPFDLTIWPARDEGIRVTFQADLFLTTSKGISLPPNDSALLSQLYNEVIQWSAKQISPQTIAS